MPVSPIKARDYRKIDWEAVVKPVDTNPPDVVFRTESPCLSLVIGLVRERTPFALTFDAQGRYEVRDLTPKPVVVKYTDSHVAKP